VQTDIPGPKSAAVLARKDAVCPEAFSIHMPVVVDTAVGALLHDIDGNTFIDFAGGVGCLNVGHSNPRVVEAIHRQVDRFTHTDFTILPYENYVRLAERLTASVPIEEQCKAAFFNSGAEAVENSIKIARKATGRQAVITFDRAFHGRTLMAMTLTSKTSPYKEGFGPFAPEVYRAPYPSVFHEQETGDENEIAEASLAALRGMFTTHVPASHVAAIIAEPVQGEGGFIVPPKRFLEGLREICDEHGIILIFDEVQSGMGRTGALWATEHFGVEPDLLLTAKSIAAGLPLSGVIGRASIMDKVHDSGIGGTYVGSPVAIEAALAVLDELEGGLIKRGREVGLQLRDAFNQLNATDDGIADVRGLGPMLAVEFTNDDGAPDGARASRVVDEAAKRGLILLKAGIHGQCIRVLVPLVITDDQLAESIQIFNEAVAASA
jgi:4-aminobutyrate aminotransferase/(S)-3-amino-2-methylpropionate transaminase